MSAPTSRFHVEARGVSRSYPGGVTALRECSVQVEPGEFLAVRGPSGCGKTTLLRLVAALDRPSTGEIFHGGRALSQLSESALTERRREIGIVFQDAAMLARLPVWENVSYPLIPRRIPRRERFARAMRALEQIGVPHLARKAPEGLSGGERQRVGVARALAVEPRLLVADEPAAHVDDETATRILSALRDVCDAGCTVIVATHRADLAAAADREFLPPR